MKFYRIEHHTIMDGLVVRYKEISDAPNGGQISASRNGVSIFGSFPTLQSVEEVKAVLDRALEQHHALMNQRRDPKSLPFNGDPACVVQLRKAWFGREDEVLVNRPPDEKKRFRSGSSVPSRLQLARVNAGLELGEAANLLSMPFWMLEKIEDGKVTVSESKGGLKDFAEAYGVTEAWLRGEDE